MTTLEDKVRETIRKHEMFSHGDGVLLGVSGGPDSVALLYLMSILRGEYGFRLAVAHLIHGIRGGEAKKDAQFVAEMAERLAIPVHLREVGLPRMKMEEGRGNLEAMGRKERYGFFAAVAEQCGLNKVATAHTGDDQAETLLMWLLRGSGRRGLSGMPPMRKLIPPGPGKTTPWLVRPLIEASRQEIMDYLTEHGLEYRTDQTNLDVRPLRNWIRHSWRTDTMGLGSGRSAAIGSEAQARRELTTKPSAGVNGPLPVCFRLLNPIFSLFESI